MIKSNYYILKETVLLVFAGYIQKNQTQKRELYKVKENCKTKIDIS
jgi:hypothetical protein